MAIVRQCVVTLTPAPSGLVLCVIGAPKTLTPSPPPPHLLLLQHRPAACLVLPSRKQNKTQSVVVVRGVSLTETVRHKLDTVGHSFALVLIKIIQ